MISFQFIRALLGSPTTYDRGITDLAVHDNGLGAALYSINRDGGGIQVFGLTGGLPALIGQTYLSGGADLAPRRLAFLDLVNGAELFPAGHLPTTLTGWGPTGSGGLASSVTYTSNVPFAGNIESFADLRIGSRTFVFAHQMGTDGITGYEIGAGRDLHWLGMTSAGFATNAAGGVGLTTVRAGGQDILLATDAIGNKITSYQVSNSGGLTLADERGVVQGLGISTPGPVETVTIGGQVFAIVAASGSSSISVLGVGSDGSLNLVDHIIDDQITRFGGVAALETLIIGDRVFVLAGGSDDGISLFTLLPDGRLLHLAQIADSLQSTLANVTALAATTSGTAIRVFASSETEPGISEFTVDPHADGLALTGTAGNETLQGSNLADLIYGAGGNDILKGLGGDDILMDGTGSDQLFGGAGADIFVFTEDGQTDTVNDFNLSEDRLDLSGFPMFRNAAQLSVTSLTDGARLVFGNETIILHSQNGVSISQAQILSLDLSGQTRMMVGATTPTISGTAGADALQGGTATERLLGNAGNDTLSGGGGGDHFDGGSGMDTVSYAFATVGVLADLANPNNNTGLASGDTYASIENFTGSAFADHLAGDSAANILVGGAGDDTLWGGDGTDRLNGGDGNDRIFGGASSADLADIVYAGAGDDFVDGGYGNDTLYGMGGNDVLNGGFGSDNLQGQDGNDAISGAALSDLIFGGSGNDFINGGFGHDRVNGGAGADRFYHLGIADHGSDWVQDYRADDGDVLLFGQPGASANDFQVNFTETPGSGVSGVQEAFVIYRPTGQIIWALVDGAAQASIDLQISGNANVFDLLA